MSRLNNRTRGIREKHEREIAHLVLERQYLKQGYESIDGNKKAKFFWSLVSAISLYSAIGYLEGSLLISTDWSIYSFMAYCIFQVVLMMRIYTFVDIYKYGKENTKISIFWEGAYEFVNQKLNIKFLSKRIVLVLSSLFVLFQYFIFCLLLFYIVDGVYKLTTPIKFDVSGLIGSFEIKRPVLEIRHIHFKAIGVFIIFYFLYNRINNAFSLDLSKWPMNEIKELNDSFRREMNEDEN